MDLSSNHYELLLPEGKQLSDVPSSGNASLLPQATATKYSPAVHNHQPTNNNNQMTYPSNHHFSFHPVPEIGEAIPIDLNRAISCEITWLDPTMHPQASLYSNSLPMHHAIADSTLTLTPPPTPMPLINVNSNNFHLPPYVESLAQEENHSNAHVATAHPDSTVIRTNLTTNGKLTSEPIPKPKMGRTNKNPKQTKTHKSKATPKKKAKSPKRKKSPSMSKTIAARVSSVVTNNLPKEEKGISSKLVASESTSNVSPSGNVAKKVSAKDARWNDMLHEYIEFINEHGHVIDHAQHRKNKTKLLNWITRQRCLYKKSPRGISKERIDILNDIGFRWDHRQAKWDDGFKELQAFVTANGHANIPPRYAPLHSFTKVRYFARHTKHF